MSTKQKKVKPESEEFDVSKYVLTAETETHIIEIPETGDEFEVQIKRIPWSKRNKIVSECLNWNDGTSVDFDGDKYVRECLRQMIVKAPWGVTDEKFLVTIDARLGSALEAIVPKAFGDDGDIITSAKKE
tara:strand:+ start:971 stop:1360 length:390 start_codon:yes stop_codon:yes gene_type:complete